MKKLFLIIFCLALLLTGCSAPSDDGADTSADQTAAQTQAGSEQAEERIYAVKDGAPTLTILYDTSLANSIHADYIASTLKAKTGAKFKIVTSPSRAETEHIIYVGLHDDVEDIYELYSESISYDGYGVVHKDGDIYICGYSETTVGKAAKKFLSEMIDKHTVKNDAGKITDAFFSEDMFFLKNPTYEVQSPTLLGSPLCDYELVIGSMPELALKALTRISLDSIGKKTGAYIRTVEAPSSECAIELISEKGSDIFGYSISSEGKKLSIRYGGVSALYAAFEELTSICAQGTQGASISVSGSAKDTVFADHPLALEDGASKRAMSANVLGTGLEDDNQCPTALRAAIMGEYILALNPDSIGLQEYYGSYTADLLSVISGKYAIVSFAGVGGPMTATAYRKDLYTVTASKAVNIKVEEKPGDPLAQNYYFTWVVLTDAQGEQYIHANLHLDYRNDTLRLKQCDIINTELSSVMARYPNAALVITGDYNSKLNSQPQIFEAIKGEHPLECAETAAPEGKRDDDRASFHTLCSNSSIITNSPSALDHIMVNTFTTSVKLHKIIYDALICHSSDHCPVIVDFARR